MLIANPTFVGIVKTQFGLLIDIHVMYCCVYDKTNHGGFRTILEYICQNGD